MGRNWWQHPLSNVCICCFICWEKVRRQEAHSLTSSCAPCPRPRTVQQTHKRIDAPKGLIKWSQIHFSRPTVPPSMAPCIHRCRHVKFQVRTAKYAPTMHSSNMQDDKGGSLPTFCGAKGHTTTGTSETGKHQQISTSKWFHKDALSTQHLLHVYNLHPQFHHECPVFCIELGNELRNIVIISKYWDSLFQIIEIWEERYAKQQTRMRNEIRDIE